MRPFRPPAIPGPSPAARRRRAGFTLMEVLVAVALTSGALVAMLQLTRMQADTGKAAEERLTVVTQAVDLLNQWLGAADPQPGVFQGKSETGYLWTVAIEQVDTTPKDQDERGVDEESLRRNPELQRLPEVEPSAILLNIRVCCKWPSWGGDKELCLVSQRVAPPPPKIQGGTQ